MQWVFVCLFGLIVFILFCLFLFLLKVLQSNIYIGRDFFVLWLGNYGNTSWQDRKQNNKGKKKTKHKVSGHGEGCTWQERNSFLISRSPVAFGVFPNGKLSPSRSPALALKVEWRVLLLQSERWVTRLSRRGGREGKATPPKMRKRVTLYHLMTLKWKVSDTLRNALGAAPRREGLLL